MTMTTRGRRLFRSSKKALVMSMLLGNMMLFSTGVLAETYTLTVKVTVVEKTCDIYGAEGIGQPINVDMGNLVIKDIDGVSYGKTDIEYFLQCDDSASDPALKLKFDGPRMSGEAANVLSTSAPNLGLRLMANNSDLNLATWRNFTYNTKPTLSVIPKGSNTGGISDGQMTASATLSVEYQ